MQTFLPYPGYASSLAVLDYRRLGKQRVEAKQIIDIVYYGKESRWKNHPVVKMWSGYEIALIDYYNAALMEWRSRGYQNIKLKYITFPKTVWLPPEWCGKYPTWLGNEAFHSSHRAALLAKNYEWYSQFGWQEEPRIQYIWPI